MLNYSNLLCLSFVYLSFGPLFTAQYCFEGFSKRRLIRENKTHGKFYKQKVQCFVVRYGSYFTHETWFLLYIKKSCLARKITSVLNYKTMNIFYIQHITITMHCVTLLLDDPLYISNLDTKKHNVVFIVKDIFITDISTFLLLCLCSMSRTK